MTDIIEIDATTGDLAEDKDYARELRLERILPALESRLNVILDFQKIRYVTQSFIHALIGEALKRYGANALDFIEFKNCTDQPRAIIELVVNYSLGGFGDDQVNQSSLPDDQKPTNTGRSTKTQTKARIKKSNG